MTLPSYAELEDVQTRRGGDDPIVSDKWDDVITAKIGEVSRDVDRMVADVRGNVGDFAIVASGTATARTFAVADGGARFLPIDDCIAVTSVTLTVSPGAAATTLVLGTDYRLSKSKGVIVGLINLAGRWLGGSSITVLACWGLMDAVSDDLREVVVIETIRSFMGDRVGNNDSLGLTPFGQMTFAKAFTSKVGKFVRDHAYGGASLRGG
jgi:hypothetical protein